MDKIQNSRLNELLVIRDFLEIVGDTNEDTRFKTSEDSTVSAIIDLVRRENKTTIIEDFEIPFVHPMITIQKWNAELKQIVEDKLLTIHQ